MFGVLVSPLIKTVAAASCNGKTFFGIPTWYEYLVKAGYFAVSGNSCQATSKLQFINSAGKLDLSIILLIALGVLDILLRVAALIAVGYIIYAGFEYITAQGEPDKAKKALGTIINACIGLGITIIAAGAVAFVGSRFQ